MPDETTEALPHRTPGHALDEAMASPGRARVVSLLDRLLRGEGAPRARALILAAVDDHTAAMVELYARPDERWGPPCS